MRFYCETYHEERDTEHCCFCSAACPQRPMEETVSGTGKETMRQSTEKITIVFTYDEMPLGKLGAQLCKRKMDIYADGNNTKNELLFSETETIDREMGKTKSGVAGAVNLLYGLLFDAGHTYYYVNDEHALLYEVADKFKCRIPNHGEKCGGVGKRFNLLWKLRFKMLQLKVKLLNVFK